MQDDAGVAGNQTGAETFEQAVDKRNDVSIFVDDGQIDRIAVLPKTWTRIRHRMSSRNEFATFRPVFLGDESKHRNADLVRICDVVVTVGKSQLLGLDHQMQTIGRILAETLQVKTFQNVQHLQRSDSLRLGAKLINVVATIGCRYRVDPLSIELGEVRKRQRAIVF